MFELMKWILLIVVCFIIGSFIGVAIVKSVGFVGAVAIGIVLTTLYYMEEKSKERNKGKVVGIDGLLLFLILSLFISPLIVILFYLVSLESLVSMSTLVDIPFYVGDIILSVMAFYIAINLWKLNSKAVTWAKVYLVARALWVLIVYVVMTYSFEAGWDYTLMILISAIFPLIWLPYLFLSKRVKNTYTSHPVKIDVPRLNIFVLAIFVLLMNVGGTFYATDGIDYQADEYCGGYCYDVEGAETYMTEIYEINNTFVCYCFDVNDEIIEESYFVLEDNSLNEEETD